MPWRHDALRPAQLHYCTAFDLAPGMIHDKMMSSDSVEGDKRLQLYSYDRCMSENFK